MPHHVNQVLKLEILVLTKLYYQKFSNQEQKEYQDLLAQFIHKDPKTGKNYAFIAKHPDVNAFNGANIIRPYKSY